MKTKTLIGIAGIACGVAALVCSFSRLPWTGGLLGLAAGVLCLDLAIRRDDE
ncbi:hypothetical protein [Bifidobacterium bombi]|uniref:hypothetical protein n=1 Tax=Bifidobacterium bombi TaxID=471511 RepID=UPI000ABC6157|nr:hypothetical protein [Bifidobacterium bombi]